MICEKTVLIRWIVFSIAAVGVSFLYSFWGQVEGWFLQSKLNFGWLINGELSQYKRWFPNYYKQAYVSVKFGVVVSIAAFALIIANLSIKGYHKLCLAVQPARAPLRLENYIFSIGTPLAVLTALFLAAYFTYQQMNFSSEEFRYHQRILSRGYFLSLMWFGTVFFVTRKHLIRQRVVAFLTESASPYNLAILRIIFFGSMSVILWGYPTYHSAYLSANPVGLPYMNWYLDVVNLDPQQYTIIARMGAVINVFIAIGLFTRVFLIVNFISVFIIIATPNFYGKMFHQHLWIWIPWLFTFSKCYDVLSVDSWIKSLRGKETTPSASSEYNLPVRFIWIMFGLVYFFPGFRKLWNAGFEWAFSDAMLNQVFVEWNQHYGWRSPLPIEHFPAIVKAGGFLVILFEMAFMFLLFGKKTRTVAVIGGISFHVITGLTLRIWFPPVLWMYVFFIDWSRLFRVKRSLESVNSTNNNILRKSLVALFIILFSGNVLCGLFGVYSYPFTTFPGYETLYDDNLDILVIEFENDQGNWVNVNEVLKDEDYRREDNAPYENDIINTYNQRGDYELLINNYWNLICARVPSLRSKHVLRFSIANIPLNPLEKGEVNSTLIIYSTNKTPGN